MTSSDRDASIRTPSQWADAQRALMERLASGPVPTIPVHATWWTNEPTWIPQYGGAAGAIVALVQGLRALFQRKRRGPAGAFVALWATEHAGAVNPDLIIEVDPDTLPTPEGDDTRAAVLGEFAPNGAMCLVLGGRRLPPIYNPRVPWGDLTKRMRR